MNNKVDKNLLNRYIELHEFFEPGTTPREQDLKIISESYGFIQYQACDAFTELYDEFLSELKIKDIVKLFNSISK